MGHQRNILKWGWHRPPWVARAAPASGVPFVAALRPSIQVAIEASDWDPEPCAERSDGHTACPKFEECLEAKGFAGSFASRDQGA